MPDTFYPGWHPDVAARAMDAAGAAGHYCEATFGDDRPLPKAMSLLKWLKWHFNQAQVGSCFANATAQCAQLDMTVMNADAAYEASRWMAWYQGRKLDGTLGGWGDGGSVTNALIAHSDKPGGVGVCPEKDAPYQASHGYLERKPSEQAFTDAGRYKLTALAQVKIGDGWKRAIFNGNPVAIGIWWPRGWDAAIDSTGRATGIGGGEYGHALAVIGWHDDWDGHLWWQIENSHGAIYHPVPADIASSIPGYVIPEGKAYSFWVRDDWLKQVLGYAHSEALAAAGPDGFAKRELDFGEALIDWTRNL